MAEGSQVLEAQQLYLQRLHLESHSIQVKKAELAGFQLRFRSI